MGLLDAGLNLFGNVVSAFAGYQGQKDTNETNMQLGREQMQFQERMSSTSYQRAVADMQAAGLNPMLAYSQGGASAPPGSMPQVQNAVSAGLNSAQMASSIAQVFSQLEVNQATADKLKAEAERTRSETVGLEVNSATAWSRLLQIHEDTRKAWASGELDMANREVAEVMKKIRDVELSRDQSTFSADVARRKAESQLTVMDIPRAKSEQQFYERIGQAQPWLRMLLEILKAGRSTRP